MTFQFVDGWEYDQTRIDSAENRMLLSGAKLDFASSRPEMRDWWQQLRDRRVTRILAQDDEKLLNGKWRGTNEQQRGTCVGQGHSRGIEDTHTSRLAMGQIVGRYVQICYEAMYGAERKLHWGATHPWGCNCRKCPDGLQGANAAEWYATKGAIARGVYAGVDLSQPREDLAITWNNSGVPAEVAAAGTMHKLYAHKSASWSEYADAIAAKCFGAICLPKIFMGTRSDQFGACEPDGDGGHCTECCGVLALPDGQTAFVIQQSWPLSAVHYPRYVQTLGGQVELRPGSYVVRQSVLEEISARYSNRVERHSYDIPAGSSFR